MGTSFNIGDGALPEAYTDRAEMHERGLRAASKELRLIGADRDAFVAALLDPPEPNEALKAAAEEYLTLRSLTFADGYQRYVVVGEADGGAAVTVMPVVTSAEYEQYLTQAAVPDSGGQ